MATPTLNDSWIQNTLATYQAGRQQDAVAMGQQVGNPWLVNIALDYQSIFGRLPTPQEVQQAQPAYAQQGGAGGSYVADLYQQQQNTPEALYQKQQAQLQQQAPQFANQVGQLFQQNLGRAPTDAETNHFGMLLASGQDPYQIQQALQQTTEYQTAQTQKFTQGLQGQLQATNADYFNKYIMPSIQSQNAMAGRTQDSSGYQAQLANAAQQQNYQLQNYLAQVAAGQYGQSTQGVTNQYNQLLNQQYGLSNAGISNALANQAYNQQYAQNLNMYNAQQQAYNEYLRNYGKTQNNALGGGLQGALSGATTGFMLGGPWGALAGGVAGGGLGAYAGSRGGTQPVQF